MIGFEQDGACFGEQGIDKFRGQVAEHVRLNEVCGLITSSDPCASATAVLRTHGAASAAPKLDTARAPVGPEWLIEINTTVLALSLGRKASAFGSTVAPAMI
jgi:hypothetical protein